MIQKLILYKEKIQHSPNFVEKLFGFDGRVEYKGQIDGRTIVDKINEIIDILNSKYVKTKKS